MSSLIHTMIMGAPTTRRLRATAATLYVLALCFGFALTSSDSAWLESLGMLLSGAAAAALWRQHDRTQARMARLRESDQCWRALMAKSTDSIIVLAPRLDLLGRHMGWTVRHANGRAQELFGQKHPNLAAQHLCDILPERMQPGILMRLQAAQETLRPQCDEHLQPGADGTCRQWLHHQIIPSAGCMLLITRDTSDTHAAAMQHATEHLHRASRVIAGCGAGVVISDALDRIESVNAAFVSLSGMQPADVIGQSAELMGLAPLRESHLPGIQEALREGQTWQGESAQVHALGQNVDLWQSVSVLRNERQQLTHHIRVMHDITAIKDRQRELQEQARHDSLTNLPNRRAFGERLNQAMARARRHPQSLAVLYIDLDGFKAVNDSLGHAAGDAVLVEVARRLLESVRLTDCVCRLAGDEFTVILEGAGPPGEVRRICQRILDKLSLPHEIDRQHRLVTPSIGAAVYESGETLEQMCQRADAAMYTAKHAGKCRFVLSVPDRAESMMSLVACQGAA